MNELREQFGGMCAFCGSKEELQFAHRIPTQLCGKNSRGSYARYYDIKKNPLCYVLLCTNCHNKLFRPIAMSRYKGQIKETIAIRK